MLGSGSNVGAGGLSEPTSVTQPNEVLRGLAKRCVLSACDEAEPLRLFEQRRPAREDARTFPRLAPLRSGLDDDDYAEVPIPAAHLMVIHANIAACDRPRTFNTSAESLGFLTREEADHDACWSKGRYSALRPDFKRPTEEKPDLEPSDYDQAADALPFRKGVTADRIYDRFAKMYWPWGHHDDPENDPESKRFVRTRLWPPFLWDSVNVTTIEQPSLARHAPHVHNILQNFNGWGWAGDGTVSSAAVNYYRKVLAQTISERIEFLSKPFPGRTQGADAQTWFGDVHDESFSTCERVST